MSISMPRLSSVARKNIMALTGLFLCLFLVIHLLGNSLLLLPPETAQASFNKYAKILSSLTVIKLAAYVTYASILIHAWMAWSLARSNRSAAGHSPVAGTIHSPSPWYTRYMGILGVVLLVFIVVHMWDFWYPYKFGGDAVATDAHGNRDLYGIVVRSLSRGWYVALYLVAMVALGLHLFRGLYHGFRSLGLHHPFYAALTKRLSQAFAIGISASFAAMCVYLYFYSELPE